MQNKYIKKSFSDCIGNTPLIKLKLASEISGCEIYGKCEFLNPGGSVKDRPALQIIKDALKERNSRKYWNWVKLSRKLSWNEIHYCNAKNTKQ